MTEGLFFNAIYLLSNAFRFYVLFTFVNIFFDYCKVTRKIEVICYALFFLINSSLFMLFSNPVVNLLNNILLVFLLTFIYRSSLLKKLTSTIIIQPTGLFIESIVYYTLSHFLLDQQAAIVISIVVHVIIYYLVVLIFGRLKILNQIINYLCFIWL